MNRFGRALSGSLALVTLVVTACSGSDSTPVSPGLDESDAAGIDGGDSRGDTGAGTGSDAASGRDGSSTSTDAGADAVPDAPPDAAPDAAPPVGCSDGAKNGSETDVDCGGGVCSKCDDAKTCSDSNGTRDCKSGVCSASTCQPPTPTDGVKNGTETDVDCGGGGMAPACVVGKTCTAPSDCADLYCPAAANRICVLPRNDDGAKNGSETDVDCGGGAPTNASRCSDGKACGAGANCQSYVCTGSVCQVPKCNDAYKNGSETDIDCGGANACVRCATSQGCLADSDCDNVRCDVGAGTCKAAAHDDGLKNLDETGIDCGGPTAPNRCPPGQGCGNDTDCAGTRCNLGTLKCNPPTSTDLLKNGTESDIDCGGGAPTNAPRCAAGKSCAVDGDCNAACNYLSKCIDVPSCKLQHGGDTCGTGEFGEAGKVHEDCCRTLPVGGYSDPNHPGKTVYVDKYEITAGRMRAFLETLGGGVDAAGNAKPADVRSYMAANRPGRWNNGWEDVMPTANFGSSVTFAIKNATTNLLYPGQDQYLLNRFTQSTWWIGGAGGPQAAGTSVNHTVDVGVFYALGANHFFPEYWAQQPTWPAGPDYAASHALNCINSDGSYGYSTYWFDQSTVALFSNGHGKYFSKGELDEKALNCTPNALFAAFCAWDGGQLATAEVIDDITANTVSPIYDAGACTGAGCQDGKLAPGRSNCTGPDGANTVITYPDGASYPCSNVYYYPADGGNTYDGSSRIAPPGRVAGDHVAKAAGNEPWMDMIGNLQEVVLKKGETARFDYRGYGTEWSSIRHHRNQQTTPRNKGGAFGARCMRFK